MPIYKGVTKMRFALFFAIFFLLETFSSCFNAHPLSDEFINYINSKQSTWKAGRNFEEKTPMSYIHSLVETFKSPPVDPSRIRRNVHKEEIPIPEYFDAREAWPHCKSIGFIKDQSACASSWALSATSVMSDRICIASNGTKQIYVSEEDLLSCCDDTCGYGCLGGDHFGAFTYWYNVGIVSGGPYNSSQGCRAYSLPPCDHDANGNKIKCSELDFDAPDCVKKCDKISPLDYDSDKTFGTKPYYLSHQLGNLTDVYLEILKNGPLSGQIAVSYDFLSYKSGVYQHVAGDGIGTLRVKILGWGIENGTSYWLLANSWNEDWGDKGFFKVPRGINYEEIENQIVVALPDFYE